MLVWIAVMLPSNYAQVTRWRAVERNRDKERGRTHQGEAGQCRAGLRTCLSVSSLRWGCVTTTCV